MPVVNVSTQKRRPEFYRFGQDFTDAKIEHMVRRNPYAFKIVSFVPMEAVSKGFELLDKDDKVLDINDQIMEVYNLNKIDIEKGIEYECSRGKSLIYAMRNRSELLFRSFKTSNYKIRYDKHYKAKHIVATEKIGGMETFTTTHEIIDHNLRYTYELLLRESEYKGEGLSKLEPVWDTLFSLLMLDEHATYFVIRVGGGLKYVKVPESKLNDSSYMANLKKSMRQVNSGNGVMILPYANIGGKGAESLDFGLISGTQINFIQIRDLLLGSLSVATGIPREVLLGSELGLKSAETNQQGYFAVLQDIQQSYIPYFKWIVETIATFLKLTLPEGWTIRYKLRETIDEMKELEKLNLKADILNKLGFNADMTEISGILGLELEEKEIDPLGIQGSLAEEGEETEVIESEEEEDEEE